METRARPGPRAHRENLVLAVLPALQDRLEKQDPKETLVTQARLDRLAPKVSRDLKAIRDYLEKLENQAQREVLAHLARLETRAPLVQKDLRVRKVLPEMTEPLASRDLLENVAPSVSPALRETLDQLERPAHKALLDQSTSSTSGLVPDR